MLVMITKRTKTLFPAASHLFEVMGATKRDLRGCLDSFRGVVGPEAFFCPFSFYGCPPRPTLSLGFRILLSLLLPPLDWYKRTLVDLLAEHHPPVAAWPASFALQWVPKSEEHWW